jgi:hypothetical protein
MFGSRRITNSFLCRKCSPGSLPRSCCQPWFGPPICGHDLSNGPESGEHPTPLVVPRLTPKLSPQQSLQRGSKRGDRHTTAAWPVDGSACSEGICSRACSIPRLGRLGSGRPIGVVMEAPAGSSVLLRSIQPANQRGEYQRRSRQPRRESLSHRPENRCPKLVD